jgi:hypothetical protein
VLLAILLGEAFVGEGVVDRPTADVVNDLEGVLGLDGVVGALVMTVVAVLARLDLVGLANMDCVAAALGLALG